MLFVSVTILLQTTITILRSLYKRTYKFIFVPGVSRFRCLWKCRTVSSKISAFSSFECLVLSLFAESRMSVLSTARLWLIRARRRFSISGLLARLGSLLVTDDTRFPAAAAADSEQTCCWLLLVEALLFAVALAVIALQHFGVCAPKTKRRTKHARTLVFKFLYKREFYFDIIVQLLSK